MVCRLVKRETPFALIEKSMITQMSWKKGVWSRFPFPFDYQGLLNNDCEKKCAFLYELHPENINKEILSDIDSVHIFVHRKDLRQNSFQLY